MPVLRKIRRQLYSLALPLACAVLFLSTQSSVTREYQVKSVFLFNFTQFVEWPAESFSSGQDPLVIGIFGQNPFDSYLEKTIAGEKRNGHPLVVQYFKNIENIKTCHILFISTDDTEKLSQALALVKGRSTLTVSDAATTGFLQQGGIIRFVTKNKKIQLQINLESAKAANLVISSKLLRLAEIFVPAKK